MQKLADYLFTPIIDILSNTYNYLLNASNFANRGINVEKIFGPVATMGSSWVNMVKVLIICVSVLLFAFVAKGSFSLYRQLKDGVKWW